MVIGKLVREYESLPPSDQAVFAAIIRAHQVFNSPFWRAEIARRHERIEMGQMAKIEGVEQLVNPLGHTRKDGAGKP